MEKLANQVKMARELEVHNDDTIDFGLVFGNGWPILSSKTMFKNEGEILHSFLAASKPNC